MLLGDAIQGREHDGHDHLVVLLYQRHDILVIPEVESSLSHLQGGIRTRGGSWLNVSYLEVGAGHTLGNLFEQRLLDFDKLSRLNNIQDLFYFTKKHDFFL